VVKHFPHSEQRVSGLASFAAALFEQMAARRDLHVFCDGPPDRADALARKAGYRVHRVARPFWLRVPAAVRRVDPASVLILSGLHKARLLYPVFRPLAGLRGVRTVFYQCVAMDRAAGAAGRAVLRRFDRVLRAFADPASLPDGRHLPTGVDVARIRAAEPAERSAAFRVGFFNHLNRTKGCDIAARAFAELALADAELIVAGTGPMTEELRNRWNRRAGVRVLGFLDDPVSELKACDAVVLPFRSSVSVLGLSQAVLEALAAGVPVVGSDVPAIAAAVRHEQEGLIARSPGEVGACIRRLYEDSALRRTLAANAARRAESFSIESTAHRLDELLDEEGT
jgi:glycosyltransferase involved in cell wall biosynthesis